MKTITPYSRNPSRNPYAFTLVELMVVVGIIALLIAIIVPAVNAARVAAKVAASKVTIGALETGAEAFRAESKFNSAYPPSNTPPGGNMNMARSPYGGTKYQRYEGASLLAWALVGADMLGTPGFRDISNDGQVGTNGTWADDVSSDPNRNGLYALDNGRPRHARAAPYVDPSKMKFPIRGANADQYIIEGLPTKPMITSICFLDNFNQPILYYKANPAATVMVAPADPSTGVYCQGDNQYITGSIPNSIPGMDIGGGYADTLNRHHLAKRDDNLAEKSFDRAIYNPSVTATRRPHRADSFILISAGPNGIYGDSDDITNYPVNQ